MKFKIQRDGKEVASLSLKHLGGGDWEIDWLFVAPEFRGKGLASQLQNRAIKFVIERGNWLVSFLEPKGGLTFEQMKQWKMRHGFKSGWYDFSERGDRKANNKRVMFLDCSKMRQESIPKSKFTGKINQIILDRQPLI